METTKSRKIILIILGIVVFFLAIICTFLLIRLYNVNKNNKEQEEILELNSMIDGIAVIDNIFIYGMHLNMSGEVYNSTDISSMELVLFNNRDVRKYELEYEYVDNKIRFYLSDKINEGIYLDEIPIGEYQLLLKINSSEKISYYNLHNKTTYSYMDYYTITRNNKNNYIEINSLVSSIRVRVRQEKLPDDIYDITIDPGHGGDDSGAIKNDIYESLINLEVATKLKEELENLGLKVKITRTGDYNPGNIGGISPYGKGGRIAIGYESKSKLFLSVHSNNLPLYPQINGVEIYTSTDNNKKLASLIADNIVSETNINYSSKKQDKVINGVYVRNFTISEINSFKKDASRDGYNFYESIDTSTQYYYVIRETGGIVTNAYVDGRNKNYDANVYYNSNIGLDGYLIELGYMTNSNDLNILLNKKSEYARAIKNAIKEYLNITE